ncbi:MAG: polysaccharide biosynthesis PFTS motif protein [Thalassospira sp.]|uniref:polysaccharide biosynthesis PFTS motif protein n=1 Tax=Thalassospira sp. TaxID=1912094 RepID=UPI0032EC7A4A
MKARRDLENHRLLGQLDAAPLGVPENAFKDFIDDEDTDAAKLCLRQYGIANNYSFLLTELSKPLADRNASISLPLPPAWRKHYRLQGLNVSRSSVLRFYVSLIDNYLRGISLAGRLLKDNPEDFAPSNLNGQFDGFFHFNLAHFGSYLEDSRRRDFHYWYQNYYKEEERFAFVVEMLGASYRDQKKPRFMGGASLFSRISSDGDKKLFRRKVVRMAVKAAIGGLLGAWWLPAMFTEAVKLEYFKLLPKGSRARRYVFNAGSCLMRPLWSYHAETSGSEVVCVFYSANFVTFTPAKDIPAARTAGLAAMVWPKIIVTDDESKAALVSYGLPEQKISVSQTFIDFSDSAAPLPQLRGKSLLVFDVPPYRTYFKASRGFHNAYYTYPQWYKFIEDIISVARKHNWTVVLKSKRLSHKFHEKAFDDAMALMGDRSGIRVLDAGMSPSRVISCVDAVIAMPFTSPAVAGKIMNKPTLFYDPGGQLDHCESLAHDLPMEHTKEGLDAWLSKVDCSGTSVQICREIK